MRIIQLQNDFTSGELDPRLRGRSDVAQYASGLSTARNVVVQPQGGATRRDGLKFIYEIDSNAGSAARCVSFEFSVNDSYMMVFTPGKCYIFKNRTLITNINGTGLDYLAVGSLSGTIINEMNWVQSADTLIIVHETLSPVQIVRGAADNLWTFSSVSFDWIPKYAFTLTKTVGTSVGTHDHLEVTASAGNILLEAHSAVHSPANIFTNTSSYYEGQYVTVYPLGRLRIIRKQTDYSLKVHAEVPLFSDDDIAPGDWYLETGYEPSWSATRGYPRSVTFHEGRLYFGGSQSRPSTLWGSNIGDFFNFNPGEALASSAVEATMDTGQFNAITDIYSGRHLQIFTTGAEHYVPQTLDEPITPSNLIIKEQTAFGMKPNIRIQNIDGASMFIQRQGKALQEFIYSDTVSAYVSTKISLLSSHLLKTPVDMAVRKSTSTDEGDRLLIVNGDDGTITCYTLLRAQNIVAATQWDTDGFILRVGVDIDDAYVVVRRTVNGAYRYFVEVFDRDTLVDSALTGGAASSVNVTHLRAKSVSIIRDGIVEDNQTVPASPYTVTFATAAASSYQVGLDFTVELKTLPVEPKLASGSLKGFKKRIFEINAEVFETQNITIDGKDISFSTFDVDVFGSAITEHTGLKTLRGVLGYSYEGQINIGQSKPLKMTLLTLDYKLSAGQ